MSKFKSDCVLLYGGGIDSTALLVWLVKYEKRNPELLHVTYGQKAYYGERNATRHFAQKYNLNVGYESTSIAALVRYQSAILIGSSMATAHIENKLEGRNLILISMAAVRAAALGVKEVFIAFHKEPEEAPFPDATVATLNGMQAAIHAGIKSDIELKAPFSDWTRLSIAKLGYKIDPEVLSKSFTCYEEKLPFGEECGKCTHCITKQQMTKEIAADIYQEAGV